MKKMFVLGLALATASTASAAPNVTNVTQKGSLLIFTDIRADRATATDPINNNNTSVQNQNPGNFNTLVRIQNDGSSDVDLKCYWLDGYKNRVDFIIPVTRNQAVWFDAASGRGSYQVNPFPTGQANGFTVGNRHPFLDLTNRHQPGASPVNLDGYGPYGRGMLACWAIDNGAQNQVKWNHLSGTATVYNDHEAYEYTAYAFYVPQGTDLQPVGAPGSLELNGLAYDACPVNLIGQFTPAKTGGVAGNPPVPHTGQPAVPTIDWNRLAVANCNINLNQDWTPVWTKLQFDVWNAEEVKFTGAYECADTWHETSFAVGSNPQQNGTSTTPLFDVPGFVDGLDAAGQNFTFGTLQTYSARYRVNGIKSTQCERTKTGSVAAVTTTTVGILGVQSTSVLLGTTAATDRMVGSSLAVSGKITNGKIVWDPEGAVPEGGIR